MSASLDPMARLALDGRKLVDYAFKVMTDDTAIKFSKMNAAQYEAAIKIIQDAALYFCGWEERKWN